MLDLSLVRKEPCWEAPLLPILGALGEESASQCKLGDTPATVPSLYISLYSQNKVEW